MNSVEKEIYKNMLDNLAANHVLTPFFTGRLLLMLGNKKYNHRVKRHITDFISILSLTDSEQ